MLLSSRIKFYHWAAVIIISLSATGCLPFDEGRRLSFHGEIAYIAWGDNNTEIYQITPSGNSGLLTTPNNESFPAWSPDGHYLAFLSTQNGIQRLAMMDADGSNFRTLAETINAKDVTPAWAFDSQMIAFACMLDQRTTICLVSVTGEWMQIMPGNWPSLGSIQWAPADPIILFHATTEGKRDIFTYTTYSNSIRNLTHHDSQDYAPTWSPDGRKIAFVSNRNNQTGIYTMNIDGTGPILLRSTNIKERLYWSPDGKQIAFSQSNGENRLCILTVTNNNLSCTKKDGSHPTWSPDGQLIVYESRRNNKSYLFLTDNECAHVKRLTINPSGSFSPSWRPQ